jgi:4-amino-4-deoxy-L-arabinose transferase-like glycosyltransferase
MIRRWLPLAAIALLITTLTLTRLGASDVCGGSEAIMGVFVQQMVESNELLFPLDNCSEPMYKPPLYHWTAAAIAFVSRESTVDSFNLRIPSAIYAIVGAILTMYFAQGLLEMRGAILSGLILASSFQYITLARIGLVDMTLTFFETLSLFAFFWWWNSSAGDRVSASSKKQLHYLFAAAMGLAVLAKGPVGALLPGAAMVIFLASEKRWSTIIDMIKPGPILLGGVLASSWYIACLIARRFDFLSLQIGSENFGRFFGTLGSMSPWYYVTPLFFNSAPWSLLLPIAVAWAIIKRRVPSKVLEHSSPEERAALCAKLFAIFWLVTVIFFELSAFKRRAYLLPLWPASAVLLSWWVLDRIVPRVGDVAYRTSVAVCLALSLGFFFFIPASELHSCGKTLSIAEMLKWPVQELAGNSTAALDQSISYRQAATAVNSIVPKDDPLFLVGIDGAEEPLVFYLERCAPRMRHSPEPIPAGYLIAGPQAMARGKYNSPDRHVALKIPYRNDNLTLLHSEPVSNAPPQKKN